MQKLTMEAESGELEINQDITRYMLGSTRDTSNIGQIKIGNIHVYRCDDEEK